MTLEENIEAFSKLGAFMKQFGYHTNTGEGKWLTDLNKKFYAPFQTLLENACLYNPWFTKKNLEFAIESISTLLKEDNLLNWQSRYKGLSPVKTPKKVAVIMAGNIPLVGFHDMMCVMMAGHAFMGKPSSKDDKLLKFLAEVLSFINKGYTERITFEDGRIKGFDAVIATGRDNTSRYFEHYFGKYPNIIRKNRNSAAIIDGTETREELNLLADDIFLYFGLGCRSVSKLYIPRNYSINNLSGYFSRYSNLINHNKWANNYEYQKAVHLIENIPHIDTGMLIITENRELSSPIAVLNYEKTDPISNVVERIQYDVINERIQCVVGKDHLYEKAVPFGAAQKPKLDEYQDGKDTMEFLLKLC